MLNIEDFFKQKVNEEYHLDSKKYVQLSNFRISAQKAAIWTDEYLKSTVNGAETIREPALHKHGVSQQRELLVAAFSWLHERDFTDDSTSIIEWVDAFLSNQ